MNTFKTESMISRARVVFSTPANDTRTVKEICDIRSAFAKEAEQVALAALTIALAFTLATVLGLLVYGFKLSHVRLLVVGVAFGMAYYGVFAASVAYTSSMCDPFKVRQSRQRLARSIVVYR
jgi:hypothetical protein